MRETILLYLYHMIFPYRLFYYIQKFLRLARVECRVSSSFPISPGIFHLFTTTPQAGEALGQQVAFTLGFLRQKYGIFSLQYSYSLKKSQYPKYYLTLQHFKREKSILVCYLLTVYLVLTADLVGSNGRSCQNFFCSKNMQIVWTEDDH